MLGISQYTRPLLNVRSDRRNSGGIVFLKYIKQCPLSLLGSKIIFRTLFIDYCMYNVQRYSTQYIHKDCYDDKFWFGFIAINRILVLVCKHHLCASPRQNSYKNNNSNHQHSAVVMHFLCKRDSSKQLQLIILIQNQRNI